MGFSKEEPYPYVTSKYELLAYDPAPYRSGPRVGLSLSDAVRILLTRVATEGGLPAGLTADADAYDAWFRAKVQEALDDPRPAVSHIQAMQTAQAIIDEKCCDQS